MANRIEIKSRALKFKLILYENRNFKKGGSTWTITHKMTQYPAMPNDEVAAFKLSGDAGVYIEFFNAANMSKDKTWAEVTLTSSVSKIAVPNMRHSRKTYIHHKKAGDDNIDGKVSKILVPK